MVIGQWIQVKKETTMKITIKRKGGRVYAKITAETKRDQKILAEGIRKGLGIMEEGKKGGDGK